MLENILWFLGGIATTIAAGALLYWLTPDDALEEEAEAVDPGYPPEEDIV